MTPISSAGTVAALLILRRPEASATDGTSNAADTILKTVNTVSAEPGKATTQAASAAANALLDKQARADALVTLAIDFLESDKFKSTDPDVKGTLKALIESKPHALVAKIEAERERDPLIPIDAAIANALTATIRDNRKQFGEDEFVIGYDTSDGKMLHYIADAEGRSGEQVLADSHDADRIAFEEARKTRDNASEAFFGAASLAFLRAQSRYDESSRTMKEWHEVWSKFFDWAD